MPFLNQLGRHTEVICGLVVENSSGNGNTYPVPLTAVSVKACVLDMIAEVNIDQKYVNRENDPIEAMYMFPLDESAAVCNFWAEVEGRKVYGVVKEKEEARQQYEEAIKNRNTAFLIEENKPDIFMAKVGNLPPGAAAEIHITYITELAAEGDAVRFFLPTTIAPRYVPPTDTSQEAKDISNISYSLTTPAPLKIQVECEMKSKIVKLVSPTHTLSQEESKEGGEKKPGLYIGKVSLANKTTDMDKDFVLLITTAEPHKPRVCAEMLKDGSSAAMVTLVPSFKLDDLSAELVFLIDRSGSMGGRSIKQAKIALKLFLHSLPTDCYFNIVGFGSTFKSLFTHSQKYTDKTLATAKKYADEMDADFGGTEIFQPMKHIFAQETIDGYLKQLIILTDGEVSNTEAVIDLVRVNAHKCRVFSLGLGASASHYLVEGIARVGNGAAVFASYEENLDRKVQQQLKNALQPALQDITVSWGEVTLRAVDTESKEVEIETDKTLLGYGKPKEAVKSKEEVAEEDSPVVKQAPYKVPPIFDGKRLVIYGLFRTEDLPSHVTITAKSPDGPLDVKLPLEKAEVYAGDIIHKLAARKLIQDLEDGLSFMHLPDAIVPLTKVKEEVVKLGCKYGLSSTYTSFIAVDEKQSHATDSGWVLNSRSVPNQMAAGWGRMQLCLDSGPHCFSSPPPCPPPLMFKRSCPAPCPVSITGTFTPQALCLESMERKAALQVCPASMSFDDDIEEDLGYGLSVSEELPSPGTEVKEKEEKSLIPLTEQQQLMTLVGLQHFDGSFKIEKLLGELLKTDIHDIQKGAADNGFDEVAWVTAISIQFFQLVLPSLEESWELVVKKAKKWLCGTKEQDSDVILEKAGDFVKMCLNM